MMEEAREKCATTLQAGPAEVEQETLTVIDMRVTQLIGRRLAQIGDQMDNKWRQQPPIQWQALNVWIHPYVLTRRAFFGTFSNIWVSKIMPMIRTTWMVPQLQIGYQEGRKWTAWVSSLQLCEVSRRSPSILAPALLLLSVSLFLLTRE